MPCSKNWATTPATTPLNDFERAAEIAEIAETAETSERLSNPRVTEAVDEIWGLARSVGPRYFNDENGWES
ncbi:MAG TPA: hypothetical protein VER04_26875 [Polyangiaceae bacterium]|nr:hypothetical protein [Polyangiaceae bacterium]